MNPIVFSILFSILIVSSSCATLSATQLLQQLGSQTGLNVAGAGSSSSSAGGSNKINRNYKLFTFP